MKDDVKFLIKEGRLDIIHGGMVQTDESCVNYASIIKNM
jgi:hypothetical protein